MGYTHYWQTKSTPADSENWNRACEDIRRLIAAAPVKVVYEYDQPTLPPEVNGEKVWFNGIGPDGHETFVVTRIPEPWGEGCGGFCKTARKPYDVLVTASLLALKAHLGDWITLSSDGNWERRVAGDFADGWEDGAKLCTDVLGYAPEDFATAKSEIEGK
jgi:hypothetical protein